MRPPPPQLEHGCAAPCRCTPMSLTAVFGMVLFVKEVLMNCTAAGLTTLPGPVYYEVYALLLSHNNLTELGPHAFAADMQVSDLRELDLRDNAITSVSSDALRGLHGLSSIAMDRNKIETLPPHLFEDCPEIEYVSLSGNPLLLPADGPFLSAPSLTVLDLSNCGLRSLPDNTFSEMTLLRILYLADNPDIGQVNTSTLAVLQHFHGLTVMRNARMSLVGPEHLTVRELGASGACLTLGTDAQLPLITKLSGQDCGLTSLPSILKNAFDTIEVLLLGRNAITSWDNSTIMPELMVLGLDLNNITRLDPKAFSNAPVLGLLNLSGNALEVPEKGPLLELPALHSLDLYNCSLHHLPEDAFSGLPELAAIDLSLNGLRNLPAGLFSKARHLQQVLLSDNGLESLPKELFANNHVLQRLHLSGNPLLLTGENPGLPPVPSVMLLELDRMELTTLQATWFDSMPNIVNLSLADNKLETISVASVEELKNLEQIRLTGNKLQCNAALLPFYDWTKQNSVHVVAKCTQPRGNWQLMEHLHFEEEEKHEHDKETISIVTTPRTTAVAAVTTVPKSTVRLEPEVVSSPTSMAESSQQAVKAASVGTGISSSGNNSNSGNGSLWVVLLVGVLIGGIAGAVLTALLARRIRCPSRASGFLPIRLRDTASVAEEYGDDERLGS